MRKTNLDAGILDKWNVQIEDLDDGRVRGHYNYLDGCCTGYVTQPTEI